jgi:YbbR domain-containing protein
MKLLRQMFTHNLGLKFVSLLLAFTVWRVITSQDIAELGFTVPLELRNIPTGVEVVGDVVNSISVRVRTSSKLIKQLTVADMYASLDLDRASLGEHTYPLTSNNMQVPVGVEIVRVVPAHVKLRLEKTLSKNVPVKIRMQGALPDGRVFSQLSSNPSEIRVEGPESHIKDLLQVLTDIIDLSGVSTDKPFPVNLSVEDPTVRLSRERVDVQVVLKKN